MVNVVVKTISKCADFNIIEFWDMHKILGEDSHCYALAHTETSLYIEAGWRMGIRRAASQTPHLQQNYTVNIIQYVCNCLIDTRKTISC